MPEARKIARGLRERVPALFVDVYSGDGVTKFLLPHLRSQLQAGGRSVAVFDLLHDKGIVGITAEDVLARIAENHGGVVPEVVVVDEFLSLDDPQVATLAEAAILHYQQNVARNRFIFLGSSSHTHIFGSVQQLIREHELGVASVTVPPQLLNVGQAREYWASVSPEFAALPRDRQLQIVSRIAEAFPLHFRVLEALSPERAKVATDDSWTKIRALALESLADSEFGIRRQIGGIFDSRYYPADSSAEEWRVGARKSLDRPLSSENRGRPSKGSM